MKPYWQGFFPMSNRHNLQLHSVRRGDVWSGPRHRYPPHKCSKYTGHQVGCCHFLVLFVDCSAVAYNQNWSSQAGRMILFAFVVILMVSSVIVVYRLVKPSAVKAAKEASQSLLIYCGLRAFLPPCLCTHFLINRCFQCFRKPLLCLPPRFNSVVVQTG